jgi:hypothetical protein
MKNIALEVYTEMMEAFEDTKERLYHYRLPVKAIHGVSCRALLFFKRDGLASLEVSPFNIAYFDEYGDPANLVYFRKRFEKAACFSKYTPEYLEELLLNTNQILSALKFNRLLGRFQLLTPSIGDLQAFGCENVLTDLNECRTCGEATRCKTNCACCAQYLCFGCWDQVPPVREERFGDMVKLQRCPGCNDELVFSRNLQT